MFAALGQTPGVSLQIRKVLIIINLQNDSFINHDDILITANRDFVDKIKTVVPHFRSMGEIIWVRTEITRKSGPVTPDAAQVEAAAAKTDKKNKQDRMAEEQNLADDTSSIESDKGVQYYHPSSRSKARMKQASAKTRLDQRSANLEAFDDEYEPFEDLMTKPRKGKEPTFFVGGTPGAELADDILSVVDRENDMVMTKHYYSAFDQTSLLMTLRMRLVTEIYLCGCLTNVGIYATAADAVQHGMDVTVVEDCLGYRSEDKHQEALRQMSDIMGVHGINSEEIIGESGGAAPPDAEIPMFIGPGLEGIEMTSLSLTGSRRASGESEPATPGDGPDQERLPAIDGQQGTEPPEQVPTVDGDATEPTPSAPQSRPRSTTSLPAKSSPSHSKGTPTASQRTSYMKNRDSWMANSRTLGPHDAIGAGDSKIIHSFLASELAGEAFQELKSEVKWQTMSHRGGQVPRLVAVQGEMEKDGGVPIYRHPADESPPLLAFTPFVQKIRRELESSMKQPFNHVLIQLYRGGNDNISEHSDKTLDIVRNSSIVNVSIGAQRVMTLRTKRSRRASGLDSPNVSRQTQRISMPHNSVFVLGPESNKQWLHGVKADKRPKQQKSEDEKAFGGERISLTFRHIGTFTDSKNERIWGQGARKKDRKIAGWVRAGGPLETEAMLIAFGKENHQTDFDWEAEYGIGFDAINLTSKTPPKLILCRNKVANSRVQLSLLDKKIPFVVEEKTDKPEKPDGSQKVRHRSSPWSHGLSNIEKPIFMDTDEETSKIEGDLAILFYLEKLQPYQDSAQNNESQDPSQINSRTFSRAAQSNELLFAWQNLPFQSADSHRGSSGRPSDRSVPSSSSSSPSSDNLVIREFEKDLDLWEAYAKEHRPGFVAGDEWTLIDCAFWPVLDEIVHLWQGFKVQRYPELSAYHERVLGRRCVQRLLEDEERL
ncbi:MAG: hypothetical protein Q9216_006440 [Gyalolechia sp. 2 TL-2023]